MPFGYEIKRTDNGKTNWLFLRLVLYTALIVWAVGVRWMGLNPFDDLLAWTLSLATLFDFLSLWALWVVVWFFVKWLRANVSL